MERILEQILDEIRSAWRYRWWALLAATFAAIVGWLVVFSLQDRYEAEARVFVDTRTALKPVLQGLTVEQDVNTQLNFARQSLLAAPQLQKVAEQARLLRPNADAATRARVVTSMADRIALTVHSANDRESDRDSAGSVYGITFQDGNRDRALQVVGILLDALIDGTIGGKRAGSESAQKFLETQIRDYEGRLRTAEDRLAVFKKEHIGLMPTEQGGYFSQLQSEIDATKRTESNLALAESKRGELARQLRGEAAITATSAGPSSNGAPGTDTVSRIKQTQAQLDELLLRFTDKHPDVVAMRQTLEDLKRRRAEEIESLRRGDSDAAAASGAAANPVFQSIQLQLNQADVEIASLRRELEQHRSKAAELRQRLDTAPQVEAEFARLNRDYDVNKSQYNLLLANYEKARLGEQADNAGSVKFQVVQPPNASFMPVSPRRTALLAGVLVGALILGGGLAYVMHLLRPTVGSQRSLSELTGLPVLGVVGSAFPLAQSREARRATWSYSAAVSVLLVLFAGAVVLNSLGVRLNLHSSASR
jgi:polysaccharide chain length determinant protein (PEP-CTERM system associated)